MQPIDELIHDLINAASQHQTGRERKLDLLTAAVVRMNIECSESEFARDVLESASGFLEVLLEPNTISDGMFEVLMVTAADLLLQFKVAKTVFLRSNVPLALRYGYLEQPRKVTAANSAKSGHGDST